MYHPHLSGIDGDLMQGLRPETYPSKITSRCIAPSIVGGKELDHINKVLVFKGAIAANPSFEKTVITQRALFKSKDRCDDFVIDHPWSVFSRACTPLKAPVEAFQTDKGREDTSFVLHASQEISYFAEKQQNLVQAWLTGAFWLAFATLAIKEQLIYDCRQARDTGGYGLTKAECAHSMRNRGSYQAQAECLARAAGNLHHDPGLETKRIGALRIDGRLPRILPWLRRCVL